MAKLRKYLLQLKVNIARYSLRLSVIENEPSAKTIKEALSVLDKIKGGRLKDRRNNPEQK